MATRRQTRFRLQDATLHPPAFSPDDDGVEIPWVLLDERAYVADHRNATTAFTTTWDNKEIQVTFCLARPPQVSYICVFCPGLDHTEFPFEPRILAMEQDLVLLSIIVSSKRDVYEGMDYYIYQAADRSAGRDESYAGRATSPLGQPAPPAQVTNPLNPHRKNSAVHLPASAAGAARLPAPGWQATIAAGISSPHRGLRPPANRRIIWQRRKIPRASGPISEGGICCPHLRLQTPGRAAITMGGISWPHLRLRPPVRSACVLTPALDPPEIFLSQRNFQVALHRRRPMAVILLSTPLLRLLRLKHLQYKAFPDAIAWTNSCV